MVAAHDRPLRKRAIPLKALFAALEPKAKTWHAVPLRPLPTDQRALRQQAYAPTGVAADTVQPPPQYAPAPMPVDSVAPSIATASATDPPLVIYDRPEEGAQQLAALCPSSPHPLPLGPWQFASVTHLYEAARFDPANECVRPLILRSE
jgi:hypothetical protein